MKFLLVWAFLIVLAVSQSAFAQDQKKAIKRMEDALDQAVQLPVASYEKATATAAEVLTYFLTNKYDRGAVKAYVSLSHIHHRSRKYQKALHYDSLALRLSDQIEYDQGRAWAFGNIGREMKALGDIQASKVNYEKALAITPSATDQQVDDLLTYYNQLGVVCRILGEFQPSILYFEKGIALAEAHGIQKMQALLYMNHANTLTEVAQYEGATAMHLKSVRIKEQLKDTLGLLQSFNNIAIVFRRAKEFDRAISYYERSRDLAMQLKNFSALGLNAVNLAVVHIEKQATDSVADLFEASLTYFSKVNDIRGLGLAYHNYGNFMLDEGQLAQAEHLMEKALAFRKKIGSNIEIASTLSNLGRLKLTAGDLVAAEKYLLDAEQRIDTAHRTAYLKDLYSHLVKLYAAKSEIGTAFTYQSKLLEMERSMFTENERVSLLKAASEYELEKRDLQLAFEKERQQKRQFIIVLFSIVLIFALLGLSGLLLLRRKQLSERHRAQVQQLAQQHRIATAQALRNAEGEERKKIAGKLHDEVGALLSIAKLHVSQLDKTGGNGNGYPTEKVHAAQRLLDEIADSVRSLSHSLMPIALEKYGLKPAILDLVKQVNATGKMKVEYIIDGMDDTGGWSGEFCMGLYRIVQEILNNIIKHAEATHVLIQLVELERSITIYVEDNGKGLDNKKEASTGMGLKLLKSNIAYLNGVIEIDGRLNQGTFVLVELPLEPIDEKRRMPALD